MEIKPFENDRVKTAEEMPAIELKSLRRFVKSMEDQADDLNLSFEFIIAAFFPDVWGRIVKFTNDCYMQGFIDGREEAQNANQRN